MINTAQLRVYVPAERLPEFDLPETAAVRVVRADGEFMWDEPVTDDAYRTQWMGGLYVCPRFPRLRMMEGVLAFRHSHPGSALMSEPAVRRAARELAEIRARHPAARSYILTAPWHVPLRWFSAFVSEEREIRENREGPSVRYRTRVGIAVTRVARSVQVLTEAGFDDSVVEEIGDLVRWLREFSGDGMLELDYHSVARLFSDGDLALDESAAEVARSLDALESGDFEAAGEAYATVATRWAPMQALAYVN